MLIGIEIRNIRTGASGGIAPLLTGLLNTLIATNPEHKFFIFRTIFNRGLVNEAEENVTTLLLPLAGDGASLQDFIDRQPLDVLFRAYPSLDRLTFPMSRQIVLIPDLQHERYPEFFSPVALFWRKLAFGRALSSAGAIATISEFVSSTIRESPQNACPDIFVTSPALRSDVGIAASDTEDAALIKRLAGIGRYFYYPANIWKHKNHQRVITAFELFKKETDSDISFVFTGHPDGWSDVARNFPNAPLHHLGFVSGRDQRTIYRNAFATVFFSLYEGFGMPLLEAFSAACPVICSNTTSLPEVGGDAVLSCDPTDIAAMAGVMSRLVAEPELRRSLVAAGQRRLYRYTWEHSASELMAAMERVAKRPPALSVDASLPMRLSDAGQILLSRVHKLGRRLARALTRKRVTGLSADCWLEPSASFDTSSIARNATLFFSGSAPRDGSVSVVANDDILATVALTAGRPVTIDFPSPGRGPLHLRFSSSTIDARRRQVSFLLDGTNLMEEADFA